MGSGQSEGREKKAVCFSEVQGYRWVGVQAGCQACKMTVEGAERFEDPRGNRAQVPGSQFRSSGSWVPKPTHPRGLSHLLSLICGNLKEINRQ